ncbi:MAG: hypothetical protein M1826_003066 [Phylliscum demangeonii]|nr:MAG: hypothetical protein M1826_003066 [Phylliscum demangeonii]
MQLSEEDRAVILREEARKAKRNHKIYLLSRDNGLMTPQDKNFITRIQLQQLVTATGNPNEHNTDAGLAEDFYYQVHTQIRGGPRQNPQQPLSYFAQTYLHQTGIRQGGAGGKRINRGGDSHIQRMEQQVQRAVEAAKNKPKGKQLVFEGSLGKISFSNVKTPKAILNIKRSDSSQDVNRPSSRLINERKAQQGGGDRKAILRQIEQVYLTLMQMEDHERRLPSQPGTGVDDVSQHRMEWAQEMKRLNRQLWSELRVMEPIIPNSPVLHPFIAFLSFAKGKKAIPRIFREIDEEQRVTILTMIVVHVGILDVVRLAQLLPGERQPPAAVREEVDLFSQAVMPSVFGYVTEAPLHIVIGLLGILLDSADTQVVARSKVGLAILTMFLSRAELVKQAGDVSDEDWSHWTALYSRLFDTLEPILSNSQRPIFPSSVNLGEDMYVWQFLAAVGLGASPEQQQRLVMAVKDRVMETVALSKTLPLEMASQRLANNKLYLQSGLQGSAKAWYLDLPREVRANWATLQQRFLDKYNRERHIRPEDVLEFSSRVAALRQGDNTKIKDYVSYATQLNSQCPLSLRTELAWSFLAGIKDHNLILRAQAKINNLTHFKFDEAHTAVIQQSRVFGYSSEFDHVQEEDDKYQRKLERVTER